jgi:hypothetical protein
VRRKYHNKRVTYDGHSFDSIIEAARYVELKLLEAAGDISCLEVHPSFDLGVCRYKADFRYNENSHSVVEDVKSAPTRTAVYRLKKKLMKERHGITITEVTAVSGTARQMIRRMAEVK